MNTIRKAASSVLIVGLTACAVPVCAALAGFAALSSGFVALARVWGER